MNYRTKAPLYFTANMYIHHKVQDDTSSMQTMPAACMYICILLVLNPYGKLMHHKYCSLMIQVVIMYLINF